jgi:hypothetical protein
MSKRRKKQPGGAFGSSHNWPGTESETEPNLTEHDKQTLTLLVLNFWTAATSGDSQGKQAALVGLMISAEECGLEGPVLVWEADTELRAGFLQRGTDLIAFDVEISLSHDSGEPFVSMSSETVDSAAIPFEAMMGPN